MIWYILLVIWIVVVPAIIIICRKEIESDIRLFIIQLYNFIIGFSAPLIHLIIAFGILMIFNDSGWDLIIENLFEKAYAITIGLVFILLFIPMNIYMKKKIKMNVFCYIVLSIMSIGLGVVACNFMGMLST